MYWSIQKILLYVYFVLCILSCKNKNTVDYDFKNKAQEAFEFCKKNGLDTNTAILVNFAIPSGKNRLVVWDFKQQKILFSSLVAQGKCSDSLTFSNLPNSNCSALGHYIIGRKTHSQWGEGYSFKLHGLDSSNYLAYYRFIVLHSADYVPEEEIYPKDIPNSSGCPTVAHPTLNQLKSYISAKKPMLMWFLFEPNIKIFKCIN
mgnify:FL=1